MPYRLFRPEAAGKLPLVVYLHGSGGQGDDNAEAARTGQYLRHACVAASGESEEFSLLRSGAADQSRLGSLRSRSTVQGIDGRSCPAWARACGSHSRSIDELTRELPIDERRIYVTGQSMGGAGVWNMIASRPRLFAAAVICCGSTSTDDGTGSLDTPLWNFHGDSDKTVPVSPRAIASRRAQGRRPSPFHRVRRRRPQRLGVGVHRAGAHQVGIRESAHPLSSVFSVIPVVRKFNHRGHRAHELDRAGA